MIEYSHCGGQIGSDALKPRGDMYPLIDMDRCFNLENEKRSCLHVQKTSGKASFVHKLAKSESIQISSTACCSPYQQFVPPGRSCRCAFSFQMSHGLYCNRWTMACSFTKGFAGRRRHILRCRNQYLTWLDKQCIKAGGCPVLGDSAGTMDCIVF